MNISKLSIRSKLTKVIFIFRKSVFRDVRTDYNLDLRFLVKLEKHISMIMVDLS